MGGQPTSEDSQYPATGQSGPWSSGQYPVGDQHWVRDQYWAHNWWTPNTTCQAGVSQRTTCAGSATNTGFETSIGPETGPAANTGFETSTGPEPGGTVSTPCRGAGRNKDGSGQTARGRIGQ